MPTLASTSLMQMRYIAESVFGTTPGAGNSTNLRMTGESFSYDLTKAESQEMRADRQVAGATTIDATASGGFNFHAQYAEYDPFIAAALQNAYTVFGTNGVGATFTATIATTTITASAPTTGASIFTALQAGQWFRLTAPGDANDGRYFRVSLSVAPTTTVITLDVSTPGTAAVGVTSCAVATSRLVNGSTQSSFSFEKAATDVSQFLRYTGQTVSKMMLNLTSAALTDGSFEFMGKQGYLAGATGMPGSPVASKTYEIHNGATGIGHLWEGGLPVSDTEIKSMTIEVDNNLRARKALGKLGNVSIGVGDFKVSGKLEVYFASGALYNKFLGDTYSALSVSTKDVAGNGYVFSLPRVMLMSSKITAGSKNSDLMASFDYQAFSDDANATAGLRKTMFIDRLGAAVS